MIHPYLKKQAIVDHVAFKKTVIAERGLNPESCALMSVVGDSMRPAIHSEDLVLVDCSAPLQDGIYCFINDDKVFIKRLAAKADGEVLIASDNRAWEPYTVPLSNIDVIGQVVWLSRFLVPPRVVRLPILTAEDLTSIKGKAE